MCFVKTNGFKHLLKYWKIVQTQGLNHKTQNISVVCVYLYWKRQVERKTRNYDNISF